MRKHWRLTGLVVTFARPRSLTTRSRSFSGGVMSRAGFSSASRCSLEAEKSPVVLIARYSRPCSGTQPNLTAGPGTKLSHSKRRTSPPISKCRLRTNFPTGTASSPGRFNLELALSDDDLPATRDFDHRHSPESKLARSTDLGDLSWGHELSLQCRN